MTNKLCIFQAEELDECCDMLKCPTTSQTDKCIARAYVNLVENYVRLADKVRYSPLYDTTCETCTKYVLCSKHGRGDCEEHRHYEEKDERVNEDVRKLTG